MTRSASNPNSDPYDPLLFRWNDHPTVTPALAGTEGKLRQTPEDFRVFEIPLYMPEGRGSHLYLRVRKRNLTTRDLVLALVRGGTSEREIGVAGLKDKRAVTEQWLSLPNRSARAVEALEELEEVEILESSRHRNKLALGHLWGNRFEVRIRQVNPAAVEHARATLQALEACGVPNYFGPQRFGRFGRNAVEGFRLTRGEWVPGGHRLKRFFLAALQSLHFNRLLSRRIRHGLFERVVIGDWARKHDTGGTFLVCGAGEVERAQRFEISATLPLYGRRVRLSEDEAGRLERMALSELGLAWTDFHSRRGDRRMTRVVPLGATVEAEGDDLIVRFSLPKGAYATSLLREVMKTDLDTPRPTGEPASGSTGRTD